VPVDDEHLPPDGALALNLGDDRRRPAQQGLHRGFVLPLDVEVAVVEDVHNAAIFQAELRAGVVVEAILALEGETGGLQ